ncbi:MAG TPA: hypothetical protein VGE11_17195 [Pseudonocardia sp.]
MWLILAIGVPVAAWLLGRIGDVIESRQGPNQASRTLQSLRRWLQNRSTGPFARRSADPTSVRDPGAPAH